MASDYINNEVQKIAENPEFESPKNMAMAAAWILGNFKGENLKVLDLRPFSPMADYFVIATATNSTQSRSMADAIISQFKKHGQEIQSREGLQDGEWILIDSGDIIIHIFQEAQRDIYALESLWKEAKPLAIPEEYYFGPSENEKDDSSDAPDYF